MSKRLTVYEQHKIFQRLVALQDEGMSVKESRAIICDKYAVTLFRLKQVEDRGIKRDWLSKTAVAARGSKQ